MSKFTAVLSWDGPAPDYEAIEEAKKIKGIADLEPEREKQLIRVEAVHPLALEKLENYFLSRNVVFSSEKAVLKIKSGIEKEVEQEALNLEGVLSASLWKKGFLVVSFNSGETDLALVCRHLAEKCRCQVEKAYITNPILLLLEGRQGKVFLAAGFFLLAGVVLRNVYPPASTASYLAAVVTGGVPVVQAAWAGLRQKAVNFNVLVLVALAAAVFSGHFLAAAEVAVLMSLGVLLEEYTIKRSFETSSSLLQFMPRYALRKRGDREERISAREVKESDLVLVAPGQRAPVDGTVVKGRSWVDQSALTGENAPEEKLPGSSVLSGSLILSGLLEVRAEKVGDETSISQTASLLDQCLEEETDFSRLIDKVAAYLLPVVLLLALIGLGTTGQVTVAVTILIGACPCALVMATPAVTRAGISNASSNGIFIKGGRYLEKLSSINCVALDKTGTLTTSSHKLNKIHPFPPWEEKELIALASAAEKYSDHPLARAIKEAALEKGLEPGKVEGFAAVSGGGVTATVDNRKVEIRSALSSRDGIPGNIEAPAGSTPVMVMVDGKQAGLFFMTGETKAEAREAVAGMRRSGISETVIISGDTEEATALMADEIGVKSFYAGLMPEEKVQIIKELKNKGLKVAMVGDGINDAPALATSDLGIAMGLKGTDLAVDTSPIVLLSDNLDRLTYLFDLGKRAASLIRQNIIFACLVIVFLVTFAFMEYVGPAAGALLHKGSAIAVILNAMRLMYFKG